MKRFVWLLQAAVFYLFTCLISFIPDRWLPSAGSTVGVLMRLLLPARRRVAEDGVARSLAYMRSQQEWNCPLDDPKEIARQAFMNIGRSLVETCCLYHGRGARLVEHIELRGVEHYERAREKGKGVILLTGHCGNWELVALGFSRLFVTPMAVVARRQNNPYLNRMVERMRSQYDNRIIYKTGGLRHILAEIRNNGVIGLLVDQSVIPDEACLINFLGRPAWASRSPVLIARKTGVSVVPAFTHREADHHVITFFPELVFSDDSSPEALIANVQLYSRAIERFILAHPTDWYWVHRRWKRT